MNSDGIKNRSLQTDLMRNAANMLQAVACMDDEAMEEISGIVGQVEKLANEMEARIADPKPPRRVELPDDEQPHPHLNLVR